MVLHGEEKRIYENNAARERNADKKEIGPPPKVVDEKRRASCKLDLQRFLLTYFEHLITLSFSPAHVRMINEVESVLLKGNRIVVAMPRGSGKTTILTGALIWATLYGHRRFPMLLTADDTKFKRLLKGVKTQFETNAVLLEDFPEVIHPVRALERVSLRAISQTVDGELTYMQWSTEQLVFPTTKYTKKAGNSGAVIAGGGLTGAATRGGVVTTSLGENLRPDCVLIDDPQTRSSAKSESQTQERWDIINGDILGMSGPGKDIAVMVSCTVIYEDDLAERLLDPERAIGWQRVRERMVTSWPDDMDSWDAYGDVQRQESAGEIDEGSAHKYYKKHRKKLDEGAETYWDDRKKPGYLSSIESAMSDYLRDPRLFLAEYQNEPTQRVGEGVRRMMSSDITTRINGYHRGVIPADCTTLTAHIDVQGKLLYWLVCAFTPEYGCYVVDYGTTPDQPSGYFTLLTARRTFARMFPEADESGAMRAAIIHTATALGDRAFKRVDGVEMKIERGLVDARWMTDHVDGALEELGRPNWMPAYGVAVKATANPLNAWKKRPGAIRGDHWIAQKPARRNLVSAFVDANFWKSNAATSLTCSPEHTRATTLFKARRSEHQLLADHFSSESASTTVAAGRGNIIDEWSLIKSGSDNHWWDNLYMCRAAASMCGIHNRKATNINDKPKPKKRKPRVRSL